MMTSIFSVVVVLLAMHSAQAFVVRPHTLSTTNALYYGDAKGQHSSESSSAFIVKEFANYDQLQDVIQLAARPLPQRPDGIVCVAKFTSASDDGCRATEADYERMARDNPATIFMRCFQEYEHSHLLLAQAEISLWPSFDVFYGGNRVARVEGSNYDELQDVLQMYQMQNSQLDLFSEDADNETRLAWGDGKLQSATKTPRTTNRFIPGYDWDKDRGFFDDLGDQFQDDFEKTYGEWTPNVED